MEEKIQKEESVSLLDIFHLLLSKLAILILVVILGGFLGGAFAIWRTIDVNYYGTEVQFYVNPERPKQTASSEGSQYGVYGAYGRHVMDNMVKLLSSESFTEQLILDGNVVPAPSTEENPWKITVKGAASEADELQQNIKFNKTLNENINESNRLLSEANVARENATNAKKEMDAALVIVQDAWRAEVPLISGVSSSYWTYSDLAFNYLQPMLTPELTNLCKEYQSLKQTAENLQTLADEAVEIAETQTETTLELWRQTNQYKSQLNSFSGQVTYSYLEANADTDDANNLARSFIYVKISVLNDQEFAEMLYERVIKVVPIYVEANMAVPNDYEGTNCQRITRTDEIHLTNVRYTTNQAIKYAMLFAAAAAVIAAVIIIIADRSDKRLRDQETITRLFNVPVLGIVPTIEDLTVLSETKKKERAKRSVLEKKEKAKQLKEKEKEQEKQEKANAELKAKQEKEATQAKKEAEKQAKKDAELKAKQEKEAAQAKKEAEKQAEADAKKAKKDAEKKAKQEAELKAKQEKEAAQAKKQAEAKKTAAPTENKTKQAPVPAKKQNANNKKKKNGARR